MEQELQNVEWVATCWEALVGAAYPKFVVDPTVPPGQVYLMSEGDLKGSIENVGTKQPEEDDGA